MQIVMDHQLRLPSTLTGIFSNGRNFDLLVHLLKSSKPVQPPLAWRRLLGEMSFSWRGNIGNWKKKVFVSAEGST